MLFVAVACFLCKEGRGKNDTAYKMSWVGCMGSGARGRSVGRRQVSVIFKSILLGGWFSRLAERASVRCPYPSQGLSHSFRSPRGFTREESR